MRYILLAMYLMFCQKVEAHFDAVRAQEVAQSAAWLRLLHYKKNGSGYKSELDGAGFFFAPSGRTDPSAELEASVQAIIENRQDVSKLKQPARCAFPERTRFLNEALGLELKPVPCEIYDQFIRRFHNPVGASLVFSSAYPNNPASMFGHTFLKIKSDRGTDLLDNGVNFAAMVADDENPVAFMYFGLTGGYVGQWSVQPYYVKVREYINFESRDLWEYEINLSPEETKRLLAHVWELEVNSHFDYYFFDENCSYQVLKALEAVKPEWSLDHHKIYLIPGESIKSALAQPGFLKAIKYRPSHYKKMWQSYSSLNDQEKDQFHLLIRQKIVPEDIPSIGTLEASILYFDFLKSENKQGFTKQLENLQSRILQRRAALGTVPAKLGATAVEPLGTTRPDWGHDSYGLELGGGHRNYDAGPAESFARFKLRTAYHDLLNNDLGYSPYAHIEFPSIELQFNDRNRQWRVEEITGLATTSLTPINALRTPISYRMSLGLQTDRNDGTCEECHVVRAEAGAGATFAFLNDSVWFYALGLAQAEGAAHLVHGYDYAPGIEGGFLLNPHPVYKAQVVVRYFCKMNASADCQDFSSYAFKQSFSLGRNQELRNMNECSLPISSTGVSTWQSSLSFVQFFN